MNKEVNGAQVVSQTPEMFAQPTAQTHPQPAPMLPGNFIPPRLTKQGKVAEITQGGGLGGSLPFP